MSRLFKIAEFAFKPAPYPNPTDFLRLLRAEAGPQREQLIADLFEKINTTMPATAPGTLTPAQTADTMAHMFAVAKYPAGSAELPAKMDELKQIQIDK